MDFGKALEVLVSGGMVTREGWFTPNTFIFKQVPATISKDIVPIMQSLPQSVKDVFQKRFENPVAELDVIMYDNQLALVNSNNLITSWSPSVSDVLAIDWEEYV